MNIKNKMEELNNKLLEASESYYQKDIEIMSNYEYDKLYDELVELEKQHGILLSNSITQSVGSEVVSKLKKEKHSQKALSLDKTKSRTELKDWLGNQEGILSWKLDGLTVVVTFKNGSMVKAVTRGNGEMGEIITHNAKFFKGIPKKINYDGELVIRGEALMTYSEFERINSKINEADKYKNPRNLASGTIRQLDSKICKERTILFKAFELVEFDKDILNGEKDTFFNRFKFLKEQGFDIVPHDIVTDDNLEDYISLYESRIKTNDFPSDGLVLFYNDIKYGKSLGTTSKFPKNGKAFKWADETATTTIQNIEWSASRTGLINPIAVFDTVELEGTSVSRATAHNVSIVKKLMLSKGSVINVYKANMIIPTILENIKPNGMPIIPDKCPSCNGKTKIEISKDGIETLICVNNDCPAKNIKRFSHFVSRNAMNIDGLSESTIEKFINNNFISTFDDIYNLSKYKDEIIKMDGFGEKSYENIINAIEKSKITHFYNLLYSVGIPNIGLSTAKDIEKFLGENALNKFIENLENNFDFSQIDNIGEIVNNSIYDWYNNTEKFKEFIKLTKILSFENLNIVNSKLSGKTFVITGTLNNFKSRDELKLLLESKGAKVANSVSAKTDYLVNNDINSNSSKNKKAKELNIPIITEDNLMTLIS